MKFKLNAGIFAIETDANSYKVSMAITILTFFLLDIFTFLKFNELGIIQYFIYSILLAIEILFLILIIRGKPLSLQKIFPGIWKNTFTDRNGSVDYQEFKIINKNQYYVRNKSSGKWEYTFSIVNYVENSDMITFAKMLPGEEKPFSFNKLKRISKSKIEGNESNDTHVVYERIE